MYLYILEDARIAQKHDKPAPGELREVGDGSLTILRFDGSIFLKIDKDGNWNEVPYTYG